MDYRVNINISPHGNVCFDFEIVLKLGAHTYGGVMTRIRTQALTAPPLRYLAFPSYLIKLHK